MVPEITEKKQSVVPDRWRDLRRLSGAYVSQFSEINNVTDDPTCESNMNVFYSEQQAIAAIAIAQLSQLMARTWENDGGWKPVDGEHRATIEMGKLRMLRIYGWNYSCRFLQFRTAKIAVQFLDKHRELINQASPILFGKEIV